MQRPIVVGNKKSGSLHSRMDITVKRLCMCETGSDQVACFRLSNSSSLLRVTNTYTHLEVVFFSNITL